MTLSGYNSLLHYMCLFIFIQICMVGCADDIQEELNVSHINIFTSLQYFYTAFSVHKHSTTIWDFHWL